MGVEAAGWVGQRAVAWVIDDAPVPADLAFTLVVIARRADENGRGSYQSAATLAAKTGKSEDQARRDVKRLRDLGLILLGDQALPEKHGIPAGQRPTVYDLPMELKGAKPVKASKNKSGRKKDTPAPRMDATPGTDATPCMDATPPPASMQGVPPASMQSHPLHGCHPNKTHNPENKTHKTAPPPTAGPPKGAATGKGTRLPDDFAVTPDMAAWAQEKAPSCGMTDHEAFCDYWRSVPGAKGRKLDWTATWRNWMRREHERRHRPTNARPAKRATADDRIAEIQALKNQPPPATPERPLNLIQGELA